MKEVKKSKIELPWFLREQRWEIVVAGGGGNGTQMIAGLARMNVAMMALGHPGMRVVLYDADSVSEANVGRQLFSKSDVGKAKSDVLINRVNMFYGSSWSSEPHHLGDYLPDSRWNCILVTCVDSGRARRRIFAAMKHRASYWLDMGNGRSNGQVILGQTARDSKRVANVFDYFPELASDDFQEDNAPSCSLAESLREQDLFINQAVATEALTLLWRWFRHGELDRQGAFINQATGDVNPLPVRFVEPEPEPGPDDPEE